MTPEKTPHASYLQTQTVICDSVQYEDGNNTGINQNFFIKQTLV